MGNMVRGVFGGGTRLLRTGVGHRLPCRRNRGGLQKGKEGCARPPSPLPHHRPDRPGPDFPHRPGNVRDPGGADIPVDRRTGRTRRRLPRTRAGTGIDGTFPNGTMAGRPHSLKVECAVPVPFGRPAAVRSKTENDGAARRREPITSKPVGSRSRGMPAVASYPSEGRSGANAGRRSEPGRSGPLNRVRIRGHRRQRGNRPALRSLPSMRAGGRRSVSLPGPGRIAERIACRSGDPDRQPIAHVRRHPRPQPQPRAPDPDRCPRPWHAPEACRAAALPGDGNPSSHPRPVHRTHHSTGRQTDPLPERLRRPGWGAPNIPLNTECRRLIDRDCARLCNNRVYECSAVPS